MVSIYSLDKLYPVYCQECFWGDKWDPLEAGQDFDFSRPFFEQFYEVLKKAPRLGIINKQSENSDYCNYSFANKNCYLTFGSHREEDCMYDRYSTKNKDSMDFLWLYNSELCYECNFSKNCYNSVHLDHCEDCQDCYFSVDLKGCKDCLFCSNLRHKQYYILNKPYSKEEYFEKLKSYNPKSYKNFKKGKDYFLTTFRTLFPFRDVHQTNCENCDGNNLENCKNMRHAFNCSDSEDVSYGFQIDNTHSSMDMTCMGYDRSEVCYQTIGCLGLFNCIGCDSCWNNNDLNYCNLCFSSKNCFGGISLQRKEFCILNKQYTREEYEELVPKIIEHMKKGGEWGMFFPPNVSPFGYNETIASEYFPLSSDEALSKGFEWSNYEPAKPVADKVILAADLPDDISNVTDDILKSVIECEVTGKPFKITPQELKFYRDNVLPIPRRHPAQRQKDRFALMNPQKLWDRQCDKCNVAIQTTFAPDRPETVYCETCYLGEVY